MKLFIITVFSVIAFANNIWACMAEPRYTFTKDELSVLANTIHNTVHIIPASLKFRSTRAYGLSRIPWRVVIDFEPHAVTQDLEEYWTLKCKYHKDELNWICEKPEINKAVIIADPLDHVRIVGSIKSDEAIKVLKYVKYVAKNERDQHKLTSESDSRLKPSDVEDLKEIKQISDDIFKIVVNTGQCKVQRIKVRKISCSDSKCKYEIISHETWWRG